MNSLRIYRLLLGLYPRWFRDAYGAEMTRLFEERRAERRGSLAAFWLRTVRDVIANALLARRETPMGKIHFHPVHRGNGMVDEIRRDVALAFRGMRRQPWFAFLALITLAVGIGANAAVFAVIDGVLLRPLAYPDEDRIVAIYETRPELERGRFSPADYEDFAAMSHSYSAVGAYRIDVPTLTGHGDPRMVETAGTTSSYFNVLGVSPILGRTYTLEEERSGAAVAVISYGTWQTIYGGVRDVLGQSIMLSGIQFQIIGVMPQEYDYPAQVTAWLPLRPTSDPVRRRNFHFLRVIARLQPQVTVNAARADSHTIMMELARAYPEANKDADVFIETLRTSIVGGTAPALRMMYYAVCCLLIIACANGAGLFLMRASARSRERAVRLALGASRLRIARQIVIEAVVYGFVAGGAGFFIASAILHALLALSPGRLPRASYVEMNGSIALYSLVLALVAGLFCAVAPVLNALRGGRDRLLTDQRPGADRSGRMTRSAFVTIQVALAVALSIGAGILVRSFAAYYKTDLGFRQDRLVSFRMTLPPSMDPARQILFAERMTTELKQLPGVLNAALAMSAPLNGGGASSSVSLPDAGPNDAHDMQWNAVSPDYFAALGLATARGRTVQSNDVLASEPVVVISQAAARQLFGDKDPIGQMLRVGSPPDARVVGVVPDIRTNPLEEPEATVYQSYSQSPVSNITIIARTDREDPVLFKQIESRAAELDPDIAVSGFGSMRSHLQPFTEGPRFSAGLVGSFAGFALVLSLIGIYGSLAYTVALRRPEIALRMAVGAQRARIARLIFASAAAIVVPGIAFGFVTALLGARLLSTLVFGISATDVTTYATVGGMMLIMAFAGALIPARHAAATDPASALK